MAFISGPVPEAFEREVTASAAAFERDLRMAWPAGVETVEAAHFRLHDGDTRLDILVVPLEARSLGLFRLPRLAVRYLFGGADEPARRRLLARLDRAMQKGGG